jgi:hypothetical protein
MAMSLTAAQIVTLSCQIAKTSGMISQAGQQLNAVLSELCQTYDFSAARTITTFNFTGTSGPYNLPADYLRTLKGKQFYTYNGQPYFMVRIELDEYDALVQQPGFQDFPRDFTVDMAQSPPAEYVWPPPSIAVPVTVRYQRQMPDITTPETSATVPWFPFQQYLITRLAGEMMQIADDDRANYFLTNDEKINAQGAGVLLRRYLNLKDDPEGRTKTVELDRRRFGIGGQFNRLPNTKSIGW